MREYPRLECSSVVNITGHNKVRAAAAPALVDFAGLLYLFHREGETSTIHYRTSADGIGWSDDRSLADRVGARTGDQPVAVVFGGRVFVIFRGEADNAHLNVTSTDGWTWARTVRIGRGECVRTSTRPAPVVFRGRLYIFFRGESGTNTLYVVSSPNGREWSTPVNLTEATRGARTAGPPFPIVFGDRLVVLVRDPASSQIGLCRTIDGTNWSTYGSMAGTENEEYPIAALHDSRLFVFFQDHGGTIRTVACGPHGDWADHGAIPRAVRWPPVPVVLDDRLVLLMRDYLDPSALAMTDSETGADWIAQPTCLLGVADTPAAVVRGRHATVVYRDADRDDLLAVDLLAPDPWGTRVADVPLALHGVAIESPPDDVSGPTVDSVARTPEHDAPTRRSVARYRDRYLVSRTQAGRPRVQVVGPARPYSFTTGDRGPSRPGGCQVVGDYLALAVEDDMAGLVRFYDLRPLARGGTPTRLPTTVSGPGRTVAVGITAVSSGADRRYVLGIHDGRAVTLLESTPAPLWSPECRFAPLFTASAGGADSIALLTDQAGDVHLLSFTSSAHGDRVRHHHVDLATEQLRKAGEYPARLGAGVHIPNQNRIEVLRAAIT